MTLPLGKPLQFLFFLFVFTAHCQNNIDFEQSLAGQYTASNSIAGWSVQSGANSGTNGACATSSAYVWNQPISEFWIRQTPILNHTKIGNILHSPLGGTKIAQLNDTLSGILMTRLTTTFPVTNANTLLELAYCGSWDAAGHACCDQPFFQVKMYDCTGASLGCSSLSLTPAGPSCTTGLTGYSVNASGVSWTNWVVKTIDLTPFIGTCVTIQIVNGDCDGGAHHGSLYFDARCRSQHVSPGLSSPTSVAGPVNHCAGSGIATVYAPLGYATYSWVPPITSPPIPANQATLSTLTITNPIPGSVYTVVLNSASGCQFISTNTIVFSQVNIAGIGSTSTCIGGSAGSATVQGNGSGSGYNYTWINTVNNATVGTTAIINGLATGIYSVLISATGSQSSSCGLAGATVTVTAAIPKKISYLKPYCGNVAYLGTSGGSNFQWYAGTVAISASAGGTAPTLSISSPVNGALYVLTYSSTQGCQDTLEFTLIASSPGNIGINSNPVCPFGNIGSAVISLTPAIGSPPGTNSFSVFSIGTTPAYSSSINPTSSNSYTSNLLLGGGSYSVLAFDGSCFYNSSFVVPTLIPSFSFSLPNSATICANQNFTASAILSGTSNPSAFVYSWSPANQVAGGDSLQTAVLSPTSVPGTISTQIYTTIVTPMQVNCPLSQTFSLTVANLLSPTINPIPNLCDNGNSYTINTSTSGGKFYNSSTQLNTPVDTLTGVISPSLAQPGVNTFTYAINVSTCVASTSGSFLVHVSPQLTVTANDTICAGENILLQVSGADTYTWSNSVNAATISVSPLITSNFNVTGRDTVSNCVNQKTIVINVESCSGVGKINSDERCKIFPNPFYDFIILETKVEISIELSDVSGRLIIAAKRYPGGLNKIDLSSLARGVYLLKVTGENHALVYKIIKNP